jgi:hypothetical protein
MDLDDDFARFGNRHGPFADLQYVGCSGLGDFYSAHEMSVKTVAGTGVENADCNGNSR